MLARACLLMALWLRLALAVLGASGRLATLELDEVPDTVLSSGVLSNTVVVGYTYESGIDPSIIPWGSLTHLVLAFFSVDQSGNVVPGSNTSPQSIVDLAHKNDVKVIASIGGSGDGSTVLAQVLSSNTTCTHMAADLANKIKEYNLDGVDFDLEFPNTAQQIQDLYVALKGTRFALDAAFGARNKTLTMTLYSSKGLLGPSAPQTDAKPFSDVVDYGLLMAYDFFGSWAEISAPNSPFYDVPGYPGLSFTSSIAAWLKSGWDPKKLVAGLPYYGRTAIVSATTAGAKTQFMPNSGAASPGGPVSKITGAWTWTDLRDPKDGALKTPQEAQQGWQRNWDSTTETPWLLHNDSQTYIGYDDLDSLAIKANHIITSGLVGAMVWMVNYDYKGELGSVVANYTAACKRLAKEASNDLESSLGSEGILSEDGTSSGDSKKPGSHQSSQHNGGSMSSAASSIILANGVIIQLPPVLSLLSAMLAASLVMASR